MVDSEKFAARLQLIMQQHDLNASSFAEKINVGRSSISHILSGRNKPSLDFVLAVLKTFDDVDLYWLLNGKGSYPKKSTPIPSTTTDSAPVATQHFETKTAETIDNEQAVNTPESSYQPSLPKKNNGKNITKVIILYDDGTFENFIP